MAGFNPFAPQAQQQQQPQMQGFQVPNVAMQDKPGLMETIAPTVMQQAMSSDAAGSIAKGAVDLGKQGAMDAWSALTGPSQYPAGTAPVSALSNASAAPIAQTVGELSANGLMGAATPSAITAATNGSLATGIAGGTEAALATQALAAPVATTVASTVAPTVAAGTVAGAAPLALMAGPFAPLVLGGMMVAANSGK
jgi:hypothetical protein